MLLVAGVARADFSFVSAFPSGSGAGQIGGVYFQAVDPNSGSLYIADQGNDRVDEFSAAGAFIKAYGWGVGDGASHFESCTTACQQGSGGFGAGQFYGPYGIAVDPSGNVYVADANRVDEFSSAGAFIKAYGWGVSNGASQFETCTSACQQGLSGYGAGQLDSPYGIAVDGTGNVYVADNASNRIDEFSYGGAFVKAYGWGVNDGASHFESCTTSCQVGSYGTGAGEFEGPYGIAVDPSGNVYVTDNNNNRVQEFDSSGNFRATFGWGVIDGASHSEICTSACQQGVSGGGAGEFSGPDGISTDAFGNVYVADQNNNRVQQFDGSGNFVLTFGWGVADGASHFENCSSVCRAGIAGSGNGQFFQPSDVTPDSAGAVYVTSPQGALQKFSTPYFNLGVSLAGSGSGSVSGAGISCPGSCSRSYPAGTSVALTATPAPGSLFSGWSGGGCSGTGTCQVKMVAAESVTATFAPADRGQHALTVTLAGNGAGTVSDGTGSISCPNSCSHAYAAGTTVTLTATPAAGSQFAGWSGGGCSGTGPCTVTLNADTLVTATFTPVVYLLTVVEAGAGTGSVSDGSALACPGACSHAYAAGSVVTLTATSAAGSLFAGWSGGGCSGTTATCTLTITADTTVTATFATPTEPTIDRVAPNQISMRGGISVQIAGLRLAGATSVTFGGLQAKILSRSDDLLTVTAPSGTPGAADVSVTSPGGTGKLADAVTYLAAPFVTSVMPSSGNEGGGLEVNVDGSGFTVDTTFTVGGATATLVRLYSATVARVAVPPGTGNAAVSASNALGGGGAATFDYIPTCANHAPQCNGEVSAHAHAGGRDDSTSGPTAATASASDNSFQDDEAVGNSNAHASGQLYSGVATAATDSVVDTGGGGADSGMRSSVTWAIQPVPTQPIEVALAYGGAANAHFSYSSGPSDPCTEFLQTGCQLAEENRMFATGADAFWQVSGLGSSAYGAVSSGVTSVSDQYCGFGGDGEGFQCGDGPPHLVFGDSAEHCLDGQCGPGAQAAGTLVAKVSPAAAERLTIQFRASAVAPTCEAPGESGGPPGDYGRCDSTATASVDPVVVALSPGYRAVSLAGPPRGSAPVLSGLSSARVDPGARVTLTGAKLGSRRGQVTLYAGGKRAGKLRVLRWNNTRIVVRAPGRPGAGTVVATTAAGAPSGPLPLFVSAAPIQAITAARPAAARPGAPVTLAGFGFSRGVSVTIGGRAVRVIAVRPGTIVATVPRGLKPGPVPVTSRLPGGPRTTASTTLVVAGSVSRTLRPGARTRIAIPGGGTLTFLAGAVVAPRRITISLEAFKDRVAVALTLGKLLKVATLELPGRIDRASAIEAFTRGSATPSPVGAPPGQLAATILGSGVYAPSQ